ncbi:hypothetical protein [Oscillatoria sp. FACHB-1407]|uniref:hypothetical protein n=1 Tax=Oscillatoria sp. FACHB-1407 TaxID=2692847 RepID=UPI0030D73DA9
MVTSIGAAYLYEKCEKTRAEVAIACVPVAIISLLLALMVAPWQIQLLLLVGALASYQYTKTKLFN